MNKSEQSGQPEGQGEGVADRLTGEDQERESQTDWQGKTRRENSRPGERVAERCRRETPDPYI